MGRYHSKEYQVSAAVVDKAVGMALGAVVALALAHLLAALIIADRAVSAKDVDDFTVRLMQVVAHRSPRLQGTKEDLVVLIHVHLGVEAFLAALEVLQVLGLHLFKINYHGCVLLVADCKKRTVC